MAATFGEMTYAVLDLLKETSDDAYYTEEHVKTLLVHVRSALLEKKYRASRNASFQAVSEDNKQQVCLRLEPASQLPAGCGGVWLRSTAEIPALLDIGSAATCTGHDLLETNATFVSKERMPYVGYNKWLRNIIYAAHSADGHLYLTSGNPQFRYLAQAGLTGVFSDPEAAAKLSHEACANGGICDIMEQKFPLESALIAPCIELVVQELSGARFAPQDKQNNAKDDLGDVTSARAGADAPVDRVNDARETAGQ